LAGGDGDNSTAMPHVDSASCEQRSRPIIAIRTNKHAIRNLIAALASCPIGLGLSLINLGRPVACKSTSRNRNRYAMNEDDEKEKLGTSPLLTRRSHCVVHTIPQQYPLCLATPLPA
jgi:hypothetical protein